MALYLIPASRENLARSIENEVAPGDVYEFISSQLGDEILSLSGGLGFRCWAMTQSKRGIFDLMQAGDDLLFSESGTGRFTHYAQVSKTAENRELGNRIWKYIPGKPWELIYFVRSVQHIDIKKPHLVVALGYDKNYAVSGVNRISDPRLSDFEQVHGTISDVVGSLARADVVRETIKLYDADFSAQGVRSEVEHRGYAQEKFARVVKKNYGWSCALCGVDERDFLIAGHIVPWSVDVKNRLNPANGICLCVFHDRAFEKGYISLEASSRRVIASSEKVATGSRLSKLLQPYLGRKMLKAEIPPGTVFLQWHNRVHGFHV